jgi:hypothetical protein
MMARINCACVDDAVAVATKLEAAGCGVEIVDDFLLDESNYYTGTGRSVFLEARCSSSKSDVQILDEITGIVVPHGSCEEAGFDDRSHGVALVSSEHRKPWRQRISHLRESRQRAVVAYHEAGHAVAAYQVGSRIGRGGVCIGKIVGAGAGARFHFDGATYHHGSLSDDANMIFTLGGWAAEAKYLGRKSLVEYETPNLGR